MAGGILPKLSWGRSSLYSVIQWRVTAPAGVEIEGASPALSVPGVRSARKSMPAYGTLRHSRSMNTLSSQRPRRPMRMVIGWVLSTSVKAAE